MNQSLVADFSDVLTAVTSTIGWPSLVTIQSAPDASSPPATGDGQVDLSTWADVAGLVDLDCMAAPLAGSAPKTSDEKRTIEYLSQMGEFHLLIKGYYPAIVQRQRALVDGVALDICAVEFDSRHIMTRLAVRRYEV